MLDVSISSFSGFVSRSATAVVALLYTRVDPLSESALLSFSHMEGPLEADGFIPVSVDVTDSSSCALDLLSCVRVPQVRVFVGGKRVASYEGFPSTLSSLLLFLDDFK